MSIIKKKKKMNNLTNDHTGRIVPRKYIVTRGDNIETPALVEIVLIQSKHVNLQHSVEMMRHHLLLQLQDVEMVR